ncbi:MAG: ATP-binding protein [Cytophagales bacterium]|nr:ATP-binding protein [Cytophagales bacterium]MDW8383448.1 ATP-binding protein [Flammeovirgaceae bacterium]
MKIVAQSFYDIENIVNFSEAIEWATQYLSSFYEWVSFFKISDNQVEILSAFENGKEFQPKGAIFSAIASQKIIENTFQQFWGKEVECFLLKIDSEQFGLAIEKKLHEKEIFHIVRFLEKHLECILLKQKILHQEKNNIIFEQITSSLEKEEFSLDKLADLLEVSGILLNTSFKSFIWGNIPSEEQIYALRNKLENEVFLHSNCWYSHAVAKHFPFWSRCKNIAAGVLWFFLKDVELICFRTEKIRTVKELIFHPSTSSTAIWTKTVTQEADKWKPFQIEIAQKFVHKAVEIIQKKNDYQNLLWKNYRKLVKKSRDIILLISQDYKIIFASESFLKVIGVQNSAQLSEKLLEYLHTDDWTTLLELTSSQKQLTTIELRAIDLSGKIHFLSGILQKTNLYAADFWLLNLIEITPTLNIVQKLQYFKKVVDATTHNVVILKKNQKEWKIEYANFAYARLVGKQPKEIFGKPFDFLDEPNSWEAQKLKSNLEQEQNYANFISYIDSTGRKIWLQCQLYFLKTNTDAPTCILLMNDITQFRQTEEKMREYSEKLRISNEELQTFAYVASHDLQEPLRTISGFSELIAENLSGKIDNETQEYLNFILEATTRMRNLIQDLLKFSRVSTEKEYLAEVNMAIPLENAIKNLHNTIESSQAIITYDKMPTLWVNETLMLQVFQNLLSNAIKYRKSNELPRIHVGVYEEEKEWVFFVKDNGIGIEEKFFERIFIIFQRLHTKEEYSGTGIGLAICRKIVEKYGGRIWVTSKVGEGSIFYFSLPKFQAV